MSFSKARLRRFNEEIPQVPSPGRYDPKQDSSVKGAVMPTTRRFPGQAVTSSSLDNIEKASTNSLGVVFRTPQLIRKVIPLTPRLQYLKEKNYDTSGSDILSSDERCVKSALKKSVSKADYKRLEDEFKALTEKHHQMILDKEMEVRILEEEISEIKIHEEELKVILEEKSKLALDRHEETLQLKENLETMVEKIKIDREEHQRFIHDLRLQISELQNKKYELETVLAEKQSVIVTINDKYSDLEHDLKLIQEENSILEHANTCILTGADEKFHELEKNVISKLQNLQDMFDSKYEEEQRKFSTKMNYMFHELNLKSKNVMDQVKQSQEKVKEFERLIDSKVKEFSEGIKEADERCKYLYRELCKVEKQRDELLVSDLEKNLSIVDIQEKFDSSQNELSQCRNTCRKYQITLNTMNETISALSNRLLESEEEVERLNLIEKDLESQKLLLEEKSQLLLAEIAVLRESMDKIQEEIIRDVTALKEDLEAKADLFKEKAIETEQALKNVIHEKQCAIGVLLKENEYFRKEAERKDELIEDVRQREQEYEDKINKLKTKLSKLEDELSEKLNAQKNLNQILNDKLESTSSLVSDLQNLKSQHESKITSLIKQLAEQTTASVSLKILNSEQLSKIESLQTEMERKKELEMKQQQYIDELISDLVLEKERSEALEVEKEKLQDILDSKKLETEKILSHTELLKQSLKDLEETVNVIENEKDMLEQRLDVAEKNLKDMKTGESEAKLQLESKIIELQGQLASAKEKLKSEIRKLEHDNINKAENILELNLNIDSLKEEIDLQNTKISCLNAEKESLNNVLEESKSKISNLEKVIKDKNLIIIALNEEQVKQNALCQELYSQLDSYDQSLQAAYNKQNEEIKRISDDAVKLVEAEEKIFDLEKQLFERDQKLELLAKRNSDLQLDEVNQMREKIEELQAKYDAVVQDRDKLSKEVGNLMGHQNIHQKIKKVAELKQCITELNDENKNLRLENQTLKSKLLSSKKQMENKENTNVAWKEEKPKLNKPVSAKKKLMSPCVLKPSNH